MKEKIYIFFTIIFIILFGVSNFIPKDICYSYLKNEDIKQIKIDKVYDKDCIVDMSIINNIKPEIIFKVEGKKIYLNNKEYNAITKLQNGIIDSGFKTQVDVMNFAFNNGFDIIQSVDYAFPQIKNALNDIERLYCFSSVEPKVETIPNSAKLKYIEGKNGVKINKNAIYLDIFNKFNKFSNLYTFDIKLEKIPFEKELNQLKNETKLRSEYRTYYGSSSSERKNNINVALKILDGIIINPGEILSFNDTTGVRTEKNGYKKAKIIKQGSFSQEFGGGVCQVSTTLYNCALLADLEIVEVNPHSLPVSYVEPSFDAMVNTGSSDLKIKNNTDKPIYIATSGDDEFCKICMFGCENPYKIIKKSKKTQVFADFDSVETSDYLAYGFEKSLPVGERKIISNGREGFESVGVLEYYIDDILIKTKQVRKNKYNPTKQVVLVGE